MSSSATAETAWIALGISAGTFVWKFVETYIRWPRLGVDLRQSVYVRPPLERPRPNLSPAHRTGSTSLSSTAAQRQQRFLTSAYGPQTGREISMFNLSARTAKRSKAHHCPPVSRRTARPFGLSIPHSRAVSQGGQSSSATRTVTGDTASTLNRAEIRSACTKRRSGT